MEHISDTCVSVLVLLKRSLHTRILSLYTSLFKGIVSRDWGELQMIPVDSLEVFSIAGSYFYFFNNVFVRSSWDFIAQLD